MKFIEDDACAAVPGGAEQCRQLAREYIPSIIAALESFDAAEACSTAGMCGNGAVAGATTVLAAASAHSGAPPASTPLTGPACPVCRLAINNVKLQLEDPANQAAVLDKGHELCAAMPADVRAACDQWIDENGGEDGWMVDWRARVWCGRPYWASVEGRHQLSHPDPSPTRPPAPLSPQSVCPGRRRRPQQILQHRRRLPCAAAGRGRGGRQGRADAAD